jgi:hypothetical protein
MATYSFTIRKGKYQLDLVTTDKELLNEQFEKWVRGASIYAKQKKALEHKEIVNDIIQAENKITEENIKKQINQSQPKTTSETEKPLSEVKNKEPHQDELDIFYAPPETEIPVTEEKESAQDSTVFDAILNNSIKNPQTELSFKPNPSIKKDNAFINFISDKKIEKKIDYLLLTAYYFSQYEQRPRFTLKQLNSKLMQNLAVIIDHSVLQEAINRDYIECLPDLTGLVGASEYRLTAYGEKTILDA